MIVISLGYLSIIVSTIYFFWIHWIMFCYNTTVQHYSCSSLNLFGDILSRYVCVLFAVLHFTLRLFIQGHSQFSKGTPLSLRGLACETNLLEIIHWDSFGVVRFELGPFNVTRG